MTMAHGTVFTVPSMGTPYVCLYEKGRIGSESSSNGTKTHTHAHMCTSCTVSLMAYYNTQGALAIASSYQRRVVGVAVNSVRRGVMKVAQVKVAQVKVARVKEAQAQLHTQRRGTLIMSVECLSNVPLPFFQVPIGCSRHIASQWLCCSLTDSGRSNGMVEEQYYGVQNISCLCDSSCHVPRIWSRMAYTHLCQ